MSQVRAFYEANAEREAGREVSDPDRLAVTVLVLVEQVVELRRLVDHVSSAHYRVTAVSAAEVRHLNCCRGPVLIGVSLKPNRCSSIGG
jgi:hypothetical protein